jgi:hypothetical protein
MATVLDDICCARLPATALAALADLRRELAIRVRVRPADDHDHAWVHWDAGNTAVLHRLLPVPGVELYARRGTQWFRPGAHLPSFAVPEADDSDGQSIPLARAVTPRPIEAIEPGGVGAGGGSGPPQPVRLGLTRATTPRDARALRCTLGDLERWAEHVPSAWLAALEAAWMSEGDGDGVAVFLLGQRLPSLPGERFWGKGLLSPLGFRPEPDLPEAALRRALGVNSRDIVVLEADAYEVIARDSFQTLTRAGVRLARAMAGGPAP